MESNLGLPPTANSINLYDTHSQDSDKFDRFQKLNNMSAGAVSYSTTKEVGMQTILGTLLSETNFSAEEIEWLKQFNANIDQSKGETQTTETILPDPHLNSGGVEHGTNVNGSLRQPEDGLQDSQDIPRHQEKGRKLTEGVLTGGICFHKETPGKSLRGSYQRHPKEVVSIMKKFYDNKTPYPTDRQLLKLSMQVGLTERQINTWFSNERERTREKGKNCAGVRYKTKNNHPDSAIIVLKAWCNSHPENLRPTKEEKIQLAEEAGLDLKKVSYWFENHRKKQRKLRLKQHKFQPVLMDTREARDEFQSLQDEKSNQSTDYWDQELWESCLVAELDKL